MHSLVRSRYVATLAIVALLAAATPVSAQFDKLLKGLSGSGAGSGLSDAKIADGLKEALQVATGKAVSLTGKTDGYFGNQAIKILMPEKLKTLETGLRTVGYGPKIDEFVLSMNRAAESAAPQAKQIFAAVHHAIRTSRVRACHDLSEGGLAVAAAEMAFAGGLGAVWVMSKKRNLALAWAFIMFSLLSIGIYLDWTFAVRAACGVFLGAFLLLDLVLRSARGKS